VYKFGGQPWFNDLITKHYKTQFTNTFGERKGKMMMQATAGRCESRSPLASGGETPAFSGAFGEMVLIRWSTAA
jgi:hypothetical protein